MTFHEKLMSLRKSAGLSQEELGDKLNVTRQTVSKWELGQTTPEMEKLIELSRLFAISIDELVGNTDPDEAAVKQATGPVWPHMLLHYEYKSRIRLFGLPLVHINVGFGLTRAKGILAIGTVAQGFIAIGAVSMGVIALGALSLGIIAVGAFALALLALGGIAVGFLAIGGVAVGIYALGGCAIAHNIAFGGYARAHIAIGDSASGDYVWDHVSRLNPGDFDSIRERILIEYPHIWRWILHLFV